MFNTIDSAIAIVKQYAGISPTNYSWDDALTVLLNQSRSSLTYRPWIVAAFHLWSASGSVRQQLYEGDGAKFLKPEELKPAIEGLLAMQEAVDGSANIPDSWTVRNVRLLCGCKTGFDTSTDTSSSWGAIVV
jgi:hypothetical protein